MRSTVKRGLSLLGLLVLPACGGPELFVPTGSWGGEGVVLEVTASGASLSDLAGCFEAHTSHALVLDSSGEFNADGEYVNFPLGSRPGVAEAAHLSGSVEGKTMTLTITLSRGARIVFVLRHGVAPTPPTRLC